MRRLIPLLLVTCVSAGVGVAGCRQQPTLSEAEYRETVVAFHTGLAAMQTSQEVLAREQLERVIALAPHEPAGWADVGLLLLRQQEVDTAVERLRRAEVLAPDHAGIQRLQALAAGRRGDLAEAVRHWSRALAIDPADARSAYAMALDLERQGGPDHEAEAQRTLDALATRTGNLAAQIEFARLAAKRDDAAALQRALTPLSAASAGWPDDIRTRLAAVQDASSEDARATGRALAFLKNVLLRLPEYRQAVAQVSTPREEVGEPIASFIVLPNPPPSAAPADHALTLTLQADGQSAAGPPSLWTGAISLTGEGHPAVASFDGTALRIVPAPGPSGDAAAGATTLTLRRGSALPAEASAWRATVVAADLNYDYRTDLVFAGAAGVRVFQQADDGSFSELTSSMAIPAALRDLPISGAWAADVDADGDLDVVLGAATGAPHVLRNNGDSTFAATQPFGDVTQVRDFVWADLDGEGVPDAAFLQEDGSVRLMLNRRSGSFSATRLPDGFPHAVALAAAAVGTDLDINLLTLTDDGRIVRLSRGRDGADWAQAEVTRAAPLRPLVQGDAGLLIADLDNNGTSDLIVTASGWTQVLLADPDGTFTALAATLPLHVQDAADLDGDGRIELVGLTTDGRVATTASRGEKQYHWQTLRPRAATAFGDQRINSFGIGGEVEVRTGLHLQRRRITSPLVHVGLGDAARAEVVRLLWPNGTVQSEFGLQGDASVAATQRLKGSCPWLFAWDGREVRFVTDVLWRSPLGLRINAQQTADVVMTEDRVKVRGDQLQLRDGTYDLRITAELWETHFFDFVGLQVVDHPEGTEVWLDERFAIPPPSGRLIVTGPVQPLAAAYDDRGRDVTAIVADRDDRHLDFAGRGAYQGVTRDHVVEVALPAETPRTGPVWLIAQGWVHPTDSSINVAISQGTHARPHGVAVQVAGEGGPFRTVAPDIGFPAGKDKTVLFDLGPFLPASGVIRVRLATNMEIFWDRLGWAAGRPDVVLGPVALAPVTAELRYRGYSAIEPAAHGAPERPRYQLDGTVARWRDLEGYHTRFGDVRPLLNGVDDRYVIMNAGDELRMTFAGTSAPAPGLVRDFVFISDGWEKDGDYNTTFSRTVLPLPTHDSTRYDQRPGRLEDDPVYRKYPSDFAEYHTRYVTPAAVRDALKPRQASDRP